MAEISKYLVTAVWPGGTLHMTLEMPPEIAQIFIDAPFVNFNTPAVCLIIDKSCLTDFDVSTQT